MKTPAMRAISLVALAAIGLSCSENSVGVPRGALVAVNLVPSFAQGPAGGPHIAIRRVTGVLRHGVDSIFAEATILGDSAVLEFQRVPVTGDSTRYGLRIQAFDSSNVLVFDAQQDLQLLPGNNPPFQAVLEYSAPDATVDTIHVVPALVALDWAGANASDNTCLNRVPSSTAVTQRAVAVTGKTAQGQDVTGVRVGWTSRDTTVATVDDQGVVRARCANKSAWIVARTFLNKVDSARVTVTAPAFSLRMSPESASVARGATLQLTAVTVDERNNATPASAVSWYSSDASRATVSSAGLVTGIANGRVIITARSGERTTVGVVQVVRPTAAKVTILPRQDTALVGQVRSFFARAYDSQNRVIGDATQFDWQSKNTAVATVSAGVVKALAVDSTYIFARIDGVKDSIPFVVASQMAPGAVQGIIKDGVTEQGISGATVQSGATTVQTGANGEFILAGLHDGDNVTVTATGYVSVTVYDMPVYSNDTLRVPAAPLAPTSSSSGTMTGRVVNVFTGGGAAGITVKAYAGINAAPSPTRPDVQPNYTATTGSDGTYSMSQAAAGAYTFVASGTGYGESNGVGIALGGSTRNNGDIILPPASTSGGIYAVLTWGTCGQAGVPCDLDAHMTGPKVSDTTRFHVYSGTTAYVAGDSIAALDVSDASGPGPEVLGIRPSAPPGVYRFSVHDVSNGANNASLALSQAANARVDVYMNNRVVATFFPPAGSAGTVWKVFEWDGARFTQLGDIVYVADPGTVP